jgi:hypothetical protein
LENFSNTNIESEIKQNLVETIQNQPQLNTELDLQFKSEPIQPLQIQPLQSLQSMPVISVNVNQIQGQPYTQFRSSTIGPQRDVPLQQSQSPVHSIHTDRASLAYDFAQQPNNTNSFSFNLCDVSQTFNVNNSPFKQKYVNTGSPEANSEKFIVPKSAPLKQRSRSRSISSPHINKDNNTPQALTVIPPQAAISLTDIHSIRSIHNVERSTSLPVYTHERKRSAPSMSKNINNSNFSSVNILYPSQQQLQSNSKLQISGQMNAESNSVPSVTSFPSHQLVLSNAYNISQGSSSGSTLIARLLTSNSSQNISNLSQQLYSTNQSAAPVVNVSHSHSSNNRSTTIDASCIGIRAPVSTIGNEKSQFLFSTEFKDPNISSITQQLNQNIKQNFVLQSTDIQSPTTQIHQMPSPVKSRSSPVATSSNDGFIAIPSPPQLKVAKSKTNEERNQYKEHRRVCHINAEQKRRCNIKNGFDTLRSLLPSLSQNTNTKISKAAMLQKAAEYIRALKNDRQTQQEEYDLLRHQVESLNQTIG